MANLTETPQWEAGITQLEEDDVLQGGPNGIDNLQPRQLANRTVFLKAQVEAARADTTAHAAASDPHPQYLTQPETDVLYGGIAGSLAAHVAAADPHSQYLTTAEGNALVAAGVAGLVNSSPITLDTLAELAAALGNDANFATTITNLIAASRVPSGTVIHVCQATAPTGYLKANGTAISRTSYAALFAAIGTTFGAGDGSTTFTLPDLRGEFLRGLDDGRGVDTGRGLGSHQSDDFKSHTHEYDNLQGGGVINSVSDYAAAQADVTAASGHTTAATGGTETRPRNVALLACIKT